MLLKKGSKGPEVKKLQEALGLSADGIFGGGTKLAVIKFQSNNGLNADGIVGWDNPYKTIRGWNRDTRGRVATQYCIGGTNVKGKAAPHDGQVVECFPNNYLGWHLGKVGKFAISKFSGGVELNNFGYLKKKDGKYYTYVNTEVKPEYVCDLGYKFRGHQYWHAYSDKQIESLRLLILHLKDIYPKMDLENGIPKMLKEGVHPKEAFEFNEDAYYARQFGLWSHTSVRKDKFDCFPQPELVEMLKNI